MTLDEVNALVPELNLIFQQLTSLRREIVARANELERLGVDPVARGARDLPGPIAERKRKLESVVAAFEAQVDRVGALGGILQDLDLGLVDFPAVLDGREVLLCWQFGEGAVTHFHAVEAGFAGRKRLPDAPDALLH
ncbi:DUF2203 domain-containing protein [Myxococcota bacterium]|nr:DUF2203 domain-containing protein [Myxococcota bacterium]